MKNVISWLAKAGANILQWVDVTYRKVVPNVGYLRFWVWSAIAFIAAGCWISVDSYWADKNNLNGLLILLGIIISLLAISIAVVGALEYQRDKRS